MKKITTAFALLLFVSVAAFSQQKATLVIIRDTGTVNWLTNYSTFHNGNFIGKIPNKSVSTVEITPGTHTFNFQFYGRKKPNEKRVKATFDAEAGKTYYVMATIKFNGLYYLPETLEITENSAKIISSKLQPNFIYM